MRRAGSLLDKIGSVGVLLAALAAPCCFPLFAAVSAAAGLSVLGDYEGIILLIFKGSALMTLAGLAFCFKRNRRWGPLFIGVMSCGMLAIHFYAWFSLTLLYSGLFGLIAATIWNYFSAGRARQLVLHSRITCPKCGHQSEEMMPTNACLFFYECSGCETRLQPLEGDCCVFCSYGSVPCPPVQCGMEECCAPVE